ncbi:MAG: OmpA family protein [Desulfovibrionales bacterium]|nr:OmpA family protein [Desulfovibrionales bacterium]
MKLPKTVFVLGLVSCIVSCATAPEWTKTKTAQGAAIGAGVGAVTGAIVGKGKGAVVGGVIGGLAGAGIGYYLDQQAKEFEQVPGVHVDRKEDRLLVTMQNNILFQTDSAELSKDSAVTLEKTADILKRYPETRIIVKGYTDDAGREEYNFKLSERRALMVRNFLVGAGVGPERVTGVGYGESFPVADNRTAAGRQKNRRVEMEIIPQQGS